MARQIQVVLITIQIDDQNYEMKGEYKELMRKLVQKKTTLSHEYILTIYKKGTISIKGSDPGVSSANKDECIMEILEAEKQLNELLKLPEVQLGDFPRRKVSGDVTNEVIVRITGLNDDDREIVKLFLTKYLLSRGGGK